MAVSLYNKREECSMGRTLRLRDLPFRKQAYVYVTAVIAAGVGIAYFSFILVTLRKTFQAATAWETVAAFLTVTLALLILGRALRLHETR
jgi:hypothetical protein